MGNQHISRVQLLSITIKIQQNKITVIRVEIAL